MLDDKRTYAFPTVDLPARPHHFRESENRSAADAYRCWLKENGTTHGTTIIAA
ncbi:hypothetical protein [Rhizobium leucaenae]|uniref:Uncharacterized protein n=1 Tax=Rhizobium leucaenae TaxID=29450 RepID=A0A7W6ZRK6_9HYPH|nr:hypothetical protein [Rhizobium leucaenae]MBB4566998.1 hypothetical protein [Rhizobium leucaenae]MBB6300808.1 hypothetical protein [Rhizobium leucaenae]